MDVNVYSACNLLRRFQSRGVSGQSILSTDRPLCWLPALMCVYRLIGIAARPPIKLDTLRITCRTHTRDRRQSSQSSSTVRSSMLLLLMLMLPPSILGRLDRSLAPLPPRQAARADIFLPGTQRADVSSLLFSSSLSPPSFLPSFLLRSFQQRARELHSPFLRVSSSLSPALSLSLSVLPTLLSRSLALSLTRNSAYLYSLAIAARSLARSSSPPPSLPPPSLPLFLAPPPPRCNHHVCEGGGGGGGGRAQPEERASDRGCERG